MVGVRPELPVLSQQVAELYLGSPSLLLQPPCFNVSPPLPRPAYVSYGVLRDVDKFREMQVSLVWRGEGREGSEQGFKQNEISRSITPKTN